MTMTLSHNEPVATASRSRLALALTWVRQNLFSNVTNSIVTLLCLWLLWVCIPPLLNWLVFQANWTGATRADCTRDGACWVFIHARFGQFMYGLYPMGQRWRINTVLVVLLLTAWPFFWRAMPRRGRYIACWVIAFPLFTWVMLYGGFLGLSRVETRQWGGLTLTLIISSVGISGALPLGILLALGRRSKMPVVKWFSIIFIELWRGVPLITVLFMSSVMLPLFLSEGTNIDKLIRALVGVILFQSAYVAEVVRGGLQALPKGQYEAAESLALGYWKTQALVILPQALKIVIPNLVNTIIELFKDTSLVVIIGLFDLFSSVQQATVDPAWLGMSTEGYVFAALVYWIFCFGMSRYSQHLERRFHTGHSLKH
ncbi:amino acid ABC transporter permease [Martelella alba]|uniref:Amino acid ABC transporter permease n=1 Tax=Martelella alba TaxID=2590451 RepID=A0ABY2SMD0_9HYPH|nr:amino acid ABC transporter permease [Martelella alba]TKI06860.1 amino acid ABC transporter permease [Martelella alba]